MMIILIGMKGCGKTTVGTLLAEQLQIPFVDSDIIVEKIHEREKGEALSFRQIFKLYGEDYFRALDTRALVQIATEYGERDLVLACGGRTPLEEENRRIMCELGTIIFLDVQKSVLLKRILAQGIPAFFPYPDDPARSFDELFTERLSTYKELATMTISIGEEPSEEVVHTILTGLRNNAKN